MSTLYIPEVLGNTNTFRTSLSATLIRNGIALPFPEGSLDRLINLSMEVYKDLSTTKEEKDAALQFVHAVLDADERMRRHERAQAAMAHVSTHPASESGSEVSSHSTTSSPSSAVFIHHDDLTDRSVSTPATVDEHLIGGVPMERTDATAAATWYTTDEPFRFPDFHYTLEPVESVTTASMPPTPRDHEPLPPAPPASSPSMPLNTPVVPPLGTDSATYFPFWMPANEDQLDRPTSPWSEAATGGSPPSHSTSSRSPDNVARHTRATPRASPYTTSRRPSSSPFTAPRARTVAHPIDVRDFQRPIPTNAKTIVALLYGLQQSVDNLHCRVDDAIVDFHELIGVIEGTEVENQRQQRRAEEERRAKAAEMRELQEGLDTLQLQEEHRQRTGSYPQ